jgi:16S rRNA (cytidine(1402)-2'-O)-methyltransferase
MPGCCSAQCPPLGERSSCQWYNNLTSQAMAGTLFVVATPLGNLEDVTVRALRVLREVDLIAAEDTRRTARLLSRYAISTPSTSFHRHNVRTRLPQLLARLEAGSTVALVTDAGTPGVSDPGVELVDACVDAQVAVDPVPGASAPLTAAVASGFPLIPLTIFGFPPHRAKRPESVVCRCRGNSAHLHVLREPPPVCGELRGSRAIVRRAPYHGG